MCFERKVGITQFTLKSFELEDEGVAELFGLELARIVLDEHFMAMIT